MRGNGRRGQCRREGLTEVNRLCVGVAALWCLNVGCLADGSHGLNRRQGCGKRSNGWCRAGEGAVTPSSPVHTTAHRSARAGERAGRSVTRSQGWPCYVVRRCRACRASSSRRRGSDTIHGAVCSWPKRSDASCLSSCEGARAQAVGAAVVSDAAIIRRAVAEALADMARLGIRIVQFVSALRSHLSLGSVTVRGRFEVCQFLDPC